MTKFAKGDKTAFVGLDLRVRTPTNKPSKSPKLMKEKPLLKEFKPTKK